MKIHKFNSNGNEGENSELEKDQDSIMKSGREFHR